MKDRKNNKKIMLLFLLIIVFIISFCMMFFLKIGPFESNSNNNTIEVNKPYLETANVSVGDSINIDVDSSKKLKWLVLILILNNML